MLSLGYNRGMDQKPFLQTGQPAPDFSLPDMEGHVYSTGDYRGQIVIINFWSAECPWSQRCDEQIIDLLQEWDAEVQYLPVASNRNEALELVQEVADERPHAGLLVEATRRRPSYSSMANWFSR